MRIEYQLIAISLINDNNLTKEEDESVMVKSLEKPYRVEV